MSQAFLPAEAISIEGLREGFVRVQSWVKYRIIEAGAKLRQYQGLRL